METALNDGVADYGNNKSIFYSFACYEEGAPLVFARQESYADAVLSEANGDGVKGAAGAYEGGWCAEFAISWDQMYQDLTVKTLEKDHKYPFNADNDFKLGVLLCYLNYSEVDGADKLTWMAGTTKGDNCRWMPTDSGVYLTLDWAEDRVINAAGVDNGGKLPDTDDTTDTTDDTADVTTEVTTEETTEVTTEETTEVTTEVTTEETTEAATTEADTTKADTTAATTDAATTAAPSKGGCGSVVGSAIAVAVIAMAGAAAVVLKKRD